MTEYLTLEDCLTAATAALGGPPQVRDWGLLQSSLARPQASIFGQDAYPDVTTKAAALVASLVKNHAFVDGNKRTALVCMRLFLALNDEQVTASDDEKFLLIIDIAEGRLDDVDAIARRLRKLLAASGA